MENENVKNEMQLEDYTYRFEEMRDAITASIDNIDKIVSQQKDLIAIIESSEKKEQFEEFIKETNEQITNLTTQKDSLISKLMLLNIFLEKCKNNNEAISVVSLLCKALNIFGE